MLPENSHLVLVGNPNVYELCKAPVRVRNSGTRHVLPVVPHKLDGEGRRHTYRSLVEAFARGDVRQRGGIRPVGMRLYGAGQFAEGGGAGDSGNKRMQGGDQ